MLSVISLLFCLRRWKKSSIILCRIGCHFRERILQSEVALTGGHMTGICVFGVGYSSVSTRGVVLFVQIYEGEIRRTGE